MLSPTQRIAVGVCGVIFIGQFWRMSLAWLRSRRIEQLNRITWREHTARSITARRYPPFHPEQS